MIELSITHIFQISVKYFEFDFALDIAIIGIWKCTYTSHIIRNLKIVHERAAKLRIEVEHIQQVITMYSMQIAVCQRSYTAVAAAHRRVDARVLTKYVVFACSQLFLSFKKVLCYLIIYCFLVTKQDLIAYLLLLFLY